MVYRMLFIAVLGLIATTTFSQGTEEQRKYTLPDSVMELSVLSASNGLAGLNAHYHSEYLYYDLYIDDVNRTLYKEGYSLRFRKRVWPDSTMTYAFQLKSEMTTPSEVRMEVEETEMDFYRVKDGNTWISLSTVLDRIFSSYEKEVDFMTDEELSKNLLLIRSWIIGKAGGSIAPFQKLRYLLPEVFTEEGIAELQPVLIGKSIRMRGHIYIDSETQDETLKKYAVNKLKMEDKPKFFTEHPEQNWILEVSMDYAVFKALFGVVTEEIHLREYEVENKYMNAAKGTELLERFTRSLTEELHLKIELDSKYKQCMNLRVEG